jgi:hypothetical protein
LPIGTAVLEGGATLPPIGGARPRHKWFTATFLGGSTFAASSASLHS